VESNRPSCPICSQTLIEQQRVVQEVVPSTVPEYRTREQQAPYRRTNRWTVVKCANGHELKQVGSGLYGMSYEF
jgi:hypothetical protein